MVTGDCDTRAGTLMRSLERRNACGYCGRRGVFSTAPDGTLHCYRDGCVTVAEGRSRVIRDAAPERRLRA